MPETNAPSSPVPGVDPSQPADPVTDAATDVLGVVHETETQARTAPRTRHRRVPNPRAVAVRRLARTVGPTALVAATLVACTTASGPPAPPTARIERTSVTTAVSSSGSLTAVTERNLGFLQGGRLTAVEVKVGQKVAEGDVLATVDDAPARRVLE